MCQIDKAFMVDVRIILMVCLLIIYSLEIYQKSISCSQCKISTQGNLYHFKYDMIYSPKRLHWKHHIFFRCLFSDLDYCSYFLFYLFFLSTPEWNPRAKVEILTYFKFVKISAYFWAFWYGWLFSLWYWPCLSCLPLPYSC